jgi:hypothetical protein
MVSGVLPQEEVLVDVEEAHDQGRPGRQRQDRPEEGVLDGGVSDGEEEHHQPQGYDEDPCAADVPDALLQVPVELSDVHDELPQYAVPLDEPVVDVWFHLDLSFRSGMMLKNLF